MVVIGVVRRGQIGDVKEMELNDCILEGVNEREREVQGYF